MKRNDILIIISLVFYSILFYKQSAGINYAIFSVILTALLFVRDNSLSKNIQWIGAAFGSIATGIGVALIGSPLTVMANITALSLMSALSISRNSSVIFGLIYAAMSYVTSIVFVIIDAVERKPKPKEKTEKSSSFWTKLMVYLAIFVVIVLFFVLYRGSNALFREFTKNINLDFISWNWVGFMILGFLMLYGFFIHRNFPGMYKKEELTSDNLDQESISQKESRLFGKSFSIYSEYFSGLVLFGLLNFLILIVNILDISYLWSGAELPEELTYADLVHQGVGNLIFSIIIAILIILFYFRSKLNFYEKKRALQILAYIWIIQNIFMVISTILRNQLYIEQYSLTHKRIGVYVYLVLAFIGLVTTFVKIMQVKSNWFLYRKNGWAFFFVMVFSCFINWDMLITNYNLQHSKTLDKYYLLDLSWSNTPDLLRLPINSEEIQYEYPTYNNYISRDFGIMNRRHFYSNRYFTPRLHFKMYDFLEHKSEMDWQSWTKIKSKTFKRIKELDNEGLLDTLYLKSNSIKLVKPLAVLENIQYLDLADNEIEDIHQFKEMKKLKYLDISQNEIDSLEQLPLMPNLQTLKISNNSIDKLSGLTKYSSLKNLDISKNIYLKFNTIPANTNIEVLDISNNNIKNYEPLRKLKKLEKLYAAKMGNRDISSMPLLPKLTAIDLSSNSISDFDMPLFQKLASYENLEELSLAGNSISNIYVFTNNIFTDRNYVSKSRSDLKPIFSDLKKLDLSNNSIYDSYPLRVYYNLEDLNIAGNKIDGTENISELTNLVALDVSNNDFRNLKDFGKLTKLKRLDISENKLESLNEIKNLKQLTTLNVERNELNNFSEIAQFKNLKDLNIAYNSFTNLNGIEEMKQLRTLDISHNDFDDYSVLYKMDWLVELKVFGIGMNEFNKLKEELPNTLVLRYENRY